MADISKFLDKDFAEKSLDELVKAPVSALKGVSEADGEALQKAFNIKSIGDLATNKFVLWAQAINTLGS